jgi:hypothetical protein
MARWEITMMNNGDLYELGKDPVPLEYQDQGAYGSSARQQISRTSNTAREIWKFLNERHQK